MFYKVILTTILTTILITSKSEIMNYQNLKENVQNDIKTNGNREITGQILQSNLTEIIDSLGKGYQFMGFAGTSTNPGNPDERVWYLAVTQGNYQYFGNVQVPANKWCVFSTNNSGGWDNRILDVGNSSIVDASRNISFLGGSRGALDIDISTKRVYVRSDSWVLINDTQVHFVPQGYTDWSGDGGSALYVVYVDATNLSANTKVYAFSTNEPYPVQMENPLMIGSFWWDGTQIQGINFSCDVYISGKYIYQSNQPVSGSESVCMINKQRGTFNINTDSAKRIELTNDAYVIKLNSTGTGTSYTIAAGNINWIDDGLTSNGIYLLIADCNDNSGTATLYPIKIGELNNMDFLNPVLLGSFSYDSTINFSIQGLSIKNDDVKVNNAYIYGAGSGGAPTDGWAYVEKSGGYENLYLNTLTCEAWLLAKHTDWNLNIDIVNKQLLINESVTWSGGGVPYSLMLKEGLPSLRYKNNISVNYHYGEYFNDWRYNSQNFDGLHVIFAECNYSSGIAVPNCSRFIVIQSGMTYTPQDGYYLHAIGWFTIVNGNIELLSLNAKRPLVNGVLWQGDY